MSREEPFVCRLRLPPEPPPISSIGTITEGDGFRITSDPNIMRQWQKELEVEAAAKAVHDSSEPVLDKSTGSSAGPSVTSNAGTKDRNEGSGKRKKTYAFRFGPRNTPDSSDDDDDSNTDPADVDESMEATFAMRRHFQGVKGTVVDTARKVKNPCTAPCISLTNQVQLTALQNRHLLDSKRCYEIRTEVMLAAVRHVIYKLDSELICRERDCLRYGSKQLCCKHSLPAVAVVRALTGPGWFANIISMAKKTLCEKGRALNATERVYVIQNIQRWLDNEPETHLVRGVAELAQSFAYDQTLAHMCFKEHA